MRIELKDLKKAFPDTPEFIVEMVENRVQEQMKATVKERSWGYYVLKTAVLVSVCCLLLGGTVYAISRLWKINMEESGKYGVLINIEGTENTFDDKMYVFRGDYLPEGMEWKDTGTSKISIDYLNEDKIAASMSFFKLENGSEWMDKSVLSYEEKEINGHQVFCVEKDNFSFYYVIFEQEQLLMQFWLIDISKEDAENIIEHITLVETDNEQANDRVVLANNSLLSDTWQISEDEPWLYEEHDFTTYYCSHEDMKNLHEVGDKVQVTGLLEAVVTNVEVSDSKDILKEDGLYEREHYEDNLFDEHGKIKNATLQYWLYGDGINTLNKVVYEEEIPIKLVSIEVTYKNISQWELENVKLYNRLVVAQEKDEGYQLKTWERKDIEYHDLCLTPYSHDYSEVLDYYGGKDWAQENRISKLGIGESKTVCWTYAVAEEDLPYLYMDLADYGEYYALKGLNWVALEKGLVNIRQ